MINFQDDLSIGFVSGAILMACLHGLLLACILVFHKKLSTKSNRYLAMSILGICIILGYEFIYWLEIENKVPLWIQYLPLYLRSVIPVGIFFFVSFLINPQHQITRTEQYSFWAIGIEAFLESLYLPINLILDDPEEIEYIEFCIPIGGWLISIILLIWLLPSAYKRVRKYQDFLHNNYSTTEGKSLSWLQNFLISILVVSVLLIISFFQYLFGAWDAIELTFGILTVCFVTLLFWIGYFLILEHQWLSIATMTLDENVASKSSKKLSTKTDGYYEHLLSLIRDKKVYTEVELTLETLAHQLQISSSYLSRIIKERENKNFYEFINHFRIEAVKSMLTDDSYSNYTIMGIAMECGFNSKSTFNKVFKKFTGETPSAFQKRHRAA